MRPMPVTVDSLDLNAYSGRWFVAYTSQTLQNTIFKDGFCIVQDNMLSDMPIIPPIPPAGPDYHHPKHPKYHPTDPKEPPRIPKNPPGSATSRLVMPSSFNITFSENLGGADGQLKTINAVATNMNFFTSPGQFMLKIGQVVSSHWVLALGPIEPGAGMDTNLQYPWTIVSDALGSTLAVLARDMTSFQQYEQSVLDRVKTLGFTTPATKPNKIYQSEMCNYPTMGGQRAESSQPQ